MSILTWAFSSFCAMGAAYKQSKPICDAILPLFVTFDPNFPFHKFIYEDIAKNNKLSVWTLIEHSGFFLHFVQWKLRTNNQSLFAMRYDHYWSLSTQNYRFISPYIEIKNCYFLKKTQAIITISNKLVLMTLKGGWNSLRNGCIGLICVW